ncbi:NYN domain-containing protein [Nonomuraea cavernae]|uniref:NYN domain-containing protein n=1 Tax=Nonomuraea cavernae TaxID=2045107 RepID=UPI003408DC0E
MAMPYNQNNHQLNPSSRWNVYIDGANLYYGICDTAGLDQWRVDVVRMSNLLLSAWNGKLGQIKYFTTTLNGQAGWDQKRFEDDHFQCYKDQFVTFKGFNKYDSKTQKFKEKQTDVRLAAQLVGDVCTGRCEAALVVSSDADIAVAIEDAKYFAQGRVTVVAAFPDGQDSRAYLARADSTIRITPEIYRKSMLDFTLSRRRLV